MEFSLERLLDLGKLQEMFDEFYILTGIPHGLLDSDGRILTGSGWQDICSNFHRRCPAIEYLCKKSDARISRELTSEKDYLIYTCPMGLIDAGIPIVVDGCHAANLFFGQFLFESPDIEQFRMQARKFGLDEAAYLDAVRRVPVISQEKAESVLSLFVRFAAVIADMGEKRLKQMRAEQKLNQTNEVLEKCVEIRTRELKQNYEELLRRIDDGKPVGQALCEDRMRSGQA